jgi:hypothetical protein
MLFEKEFIGTLSVVIGFCGYIPYLFGLYRRKLKPHIFTWLLWGLLMVVAFAGQIASGGGPGSWVTGISGFMCLLIAVISFFHGEKNITRSDWVTFIAGISTIPLWIVTNTPLWSMLLIILIEFLATWPTARKSWMQPQQESPLSYLIAIIKFVLSAYAMADFNWITMSYPIALIVMNLGLVILIMMRRYSLDKRLNWD